MKIAAVARPLAIAAASDPEYAVPIQRSACRLTPKAAGQPAQNGGSAMRRKCPHSSGHRIILKAAVGSGSANRFAGSFASVVKLQGECDDEGVNAFHARYSKADPDGKAVIVLVMSLPVDIEPVHAQQI